MELKILSGSANSSLAESVAGALGVHRVEVLLERFPDTELHVEIQQSVRGADVYIVQPTCPPVDEHLVELLLIGDACRRAGAGYLTAVVPYFGYARQDRRAHRREPLSVRLIADLISASGFQRLMAVDLHSHAVESAFAIPVEHVSAVSLLAEAARPSIGERAVVISPDLGAVKMAERYAKLLDLPVAVIHKSRISGQNVRVERILGEVCDKEVLVIDDMISTGETIEKAIKSLLEAGCVPSRLKVSATHGLFVGPAAERLGALGIERIFVSDSVPAPETFPAPLQIVSIGPLLAHAIERLHRRESLGDLTARE